MSSDIFLGGVSPYTPGEPAHESVEPTPPRAREKSGGQAAPAETRSKEAAQVPAPDVRVQPVKHLSFDELRDLMRKVNMYIDPFELQVRFIVDDNSGDVVLNIVYTVSGEVIRRIPSSEFEAALKAPGGIRGLFTDRLA